MFLHELISSFGYNYYFNNRIEEEYNRYNDLSIEELHQFVDKELHHEIIDNILYFDDIDLN